MTPINPSFIDARDAIIARRLRDQRLRQREARSGAASPTAASATAPSPPYRVSGRYAGSHQGIGESFSVPYLDVVNPLPTSPSTTAPATTTAPSIRASRSS